MSKRLSSPITSPFKSSVPTRKKPKTTTSTATNNVDAPKAVCVLILPVKPDHCDDEIELPTAATLPRPQPLIELDENCPGVYDMKGIAWVPLTYAEKGIGKIMYKKTEESKQKQNFLEDASVLGKSINVKSDVATESGCHGHWDKGESDWYDNNGLVTVVTQDINEEDLTKQARQHCNDNLCPRIEEICKANEIRLYKGQEPKLREDKDIRVVKHWSDALKMDDIEYIWYQYYNAKFNKVLVANPWAVYSIWAPGKVPIEEKYNFLNPKFLHPSDLKKCDEQTAAINSILANNDKAKGVLSTRKG